GAAGAEIDAEVGLRDVGDADVVSAERLVGDHIAGDGGGVAEVEGGGTVDDELRAGRRSVEGQDGAHHPRLLVRDPPNGDVEDEGLAGKKSRGDERDEDAESN